MAERIPLLMVMMNFAHQISLRSTCKRASVGCVITSFDLEEVYSYGYNGVAKGIPNGCLSDEPGKCGCIHAEQNALYKKGKKLPAIMFTTVQPCELCQAAILNSNISHIFYLRPYRLPLAPWFTRNCLSYDLTNMSYEAMNQTLKNLRGLT